MGSCASRVRLQVHRVACDKWRCAHVRSSAPSPKCSPTTPTAPPRVPQMARPPRSASPAPAASPGEQPHEIFLYQQSCTCTLATRIAVRRRNAARQLASSVRSSSRGVSWWAVGLGLGADWGRVLCVSSAALCVGQRHKHQRHGPHVLVSCRKRAERKYVR